MFGFLIAGVLVSPVAFLATGLYGVSRKRAEEGRDSLRASYVSLSLTEAKPANAYTSVDHRSSYYIDPCDRLSA